MLYEIRRNIGTIHSIPRKKKKSLLRWWLYRQSVQCPDRCLSERRINAGMLYRTHHLCLTWQSSSWFYTSPLPPNLVPQPGEAGLVVILKIKSAVPVPAPDIGRLVP